MKHLTHLLRVYLVSVTLLCLSLQSHGAESSSKNIIIATYDPVRTDKPYGPFAINKYLFEKMGYQVEFRRTPAKRMPFSLNSGAIDAYSSSRLRRSIEVEHLGDDGFLQVTYPETVTSIYVYYKKSPDWQPSWPPNDNFIRKARGVSLNYGYFSLTGFNMLQIGDYTAGYKMVNYGRADFWVDTIPTTGKYAQLKKNESDGYVRDHLTYNPLFLTFLNNERGREIKARWDQAFRELFPQTELYKDIYLENLPGRRSQLLGGYLEYIENQFPEFQSPSLSAAETP